MNFLSKILLTVLCGGAMMAVPHNMFSQVTGGRHVFEFLNLSNSPYVAGSGGILPASDVIDVSLMLQNPSLIRENMHNQVAFSNNFYFADISVQNLSYSFYLPQHKTNYGFSLQNVSYGQFVETDAFGNHTGKFNANDFLLTFSASRAYRNNWRYGVNLKWVNSSLGQTSAMGILTDVGISYIDPEKKLTFGVVAKNMGVKLKKYNQSYPQEPLPFDLQIGVMKGLKNIPLKVFASAHHLYKWDIRYNDPSRVKVDLFGNPTEDPNKKYTIDKLFRHINLGAELTIGKIIHVNVGFNHLRRSELGFNQAKGLSGFSVGVNVDLKKVQVGLSHSVFGNGMAFQEVGFKVPLNRFIKVKKDSRLDKLGWNDRY